MKKTIIILTMLMTVCTAWAQDEFIGNRPMPGLHRESSEFQVSGSMDGRENIAERANIGTPNPKYRVPVIMVQFNDWTFRTSKAHVDSLFNGKTWSSYYRGESVQKYFSDASGGLYEPIFDIYGPVTTNGSCTDYYKVTSGGSILTSNMGALIQSACSAIDSEADFTQYDANGDGYIDLLFIYYAGYGSNDNTYIPADSLLHSGDQLKLIWPHYSTTSFNGTYDGMRVREYECSNELDGLLAYFNHQDPSRNIPLTAGCGVLVHEFGHALGLPDLYSTTGDRTVKRLGMWDVMDYGCYNRYAHIPTSLSAWERWFMGWIEPEQLILDPTTTQYDTLPELISSNKAYYFTPNNQPVTNPRNHPTPIYILENRQKTSWNRYCPGDGLMVTKVTYKPNYSTWQGCNNQLPHGVDIIEADGLAPNFDSSNQSNGFYGKAGDLFPAGSDHCDSLHIYNVQYHGDSITFEYGFSGVPSDILSITATTENGQKACKVIRNGMVVVQNAGLEYDLTGAPVHRIAPRHNIPAYPGLIEREMANGDTLRIYIRGDERGHYIITEDGYRVAEKSDIFYYTRKSGKLSLRVARDADKRSKRDMRWLKWWGKKIDELPHRELE